MPRTLYFSETLKYIHIHALRDVFIAVYLTLTKISERGVMIHTSPSYHAMGPSSNPLREDAL